MFLKKITFLFVLSFSIIITSCAGGSTDNNSDVTCGNGVCDDGESANTCPQDCSESCGNGVCDDGESANTCPQDCSESDCGNGVAETGEDCDASDLNGATCESFGKISGVLICTASCTYDLSQCKSDCENTCETENDTRCNGYSIETCTLGDNGCLDWTAGTNCNEESKICDDASGVAVCVLACSDNCSNENDTRCNGNTVETCQFDTSGCLDWEVDTNCETESKVCDASSGVAQCKFDCNDNCTTAGETRCTGNSVETCQTASSGCLDWVETEDCNTGSRTCTSGVCECNNDCTAAGDTSCSGSVIQTCTQDSYGCFHFVPGTDCAASGEVCLNGSCEPVPDYTYSSFTGYYSSFTGTDVTSGATTADDEKYEITLPFPVTFYGTVYTTAWIGTNGWLAFGADPGYVSLSNTALPNTTSPEVAIYPFWDDLKLDKATWSTAKLQYTVNGNIGNRVITFDWHDFIRYGQTSYRLSFQINIYEASGIVEIVYDHSNWISGTACSATIGIEDHNISRFHAIGDANNTTHPASDVRYTPVN